MTVLFSDLKGSTELYERIGDLRAYGLVREHFGLLRDIIAERGGSMVKTTGNRPFKPEGYPSVSVYVMANGAQRVIDFLKATFDAKQMRRQDSPTGSIRHAEVRIDDTVVMISEGGGNFPAFPVLTAVVE